MYHIRFHGRGGQGMKTASRMLGSAFFLAGYEVQDAPRYGAERRGAPIFAYVRASKRSIQERGIITRPDLVVVADDTLPAIPSAGVLQGMGARTILLIVSGRAPEEWRSRLNTMASVLVMPPLGDDRGDAPCISAYCAGAAARLLGVIERTTLQRAIEQELAPFDPETVAGNLEHALQAFDLLRQQAACVEESGPVEADGFVWPAWVNLPHDAARVSAPHIHAVATSVQVNTGVWRTMRPVIDYDRCNRCTWVCGSYCPDGVITQDADGFPVIDYDHCKGCMICVVQCPTHAIAAIPEREAAENEATGEPA